MFRGRIGNWGWQFESLKTRFIKRGFSEMIARNKSVRRWHAKIGFSYFSAGFGYATRIFKLLGSRHLLDKLCKAMIVLCFKNFKSIHNCKIRQYFLKLAIMILKTYGISADLHQNKQIIFIQAIKTRLRKSGNRQIWASVLEIRDVAGTRSNNRMKDEKMKIYEILESKYFKTRSIKICQHGISAMCKQCLFWIPKQNFNICSFGTLN